MAVSSEEASHGISDSIVTEFATYEDFLDSQITPTDLYYLEDEELARQLVELGYRGSGEVLKREEFEAKKQAAAASKLARRDQQKVLCSAGKNLKGSVFLEALAAREEPNRNGKMTSIIFIRDKNAKGQEISGYVDFAHRLKMEDFDPYFASRRKLLPRHMDLSFYNWDTGFSTSNSTPNYQVIADSATGLLFKNKRDRKIINVDPKVFESRRGRRECLSTSPDEIWSMVAVTVEKSPLDLTNCLLGASSPGDNTTRTSIPTSKYTQVVVYDHITRRKA